VQIDVVHLSKVSRALLAEVNIVFFFLFMSHEALIENAQAHSFDDETDDLITAGTE
jgi:hypothetical protein